MSTPQLHEIYAVTVDGVLIDEAMEVDTTIQSDDVIVKAILKDFPGITPGPSVRVTRFKNTMPSSGPSIDFEAKKVLKQPSVVQLQRLGSGDMCVTTCYVQGDVSTTSGVGKNTEQDVNLVGAATLFQ